MKHLYIGSFITPSLYDWVYLDSKTKITASTTSFQLAFLSGFDGQLSPDVINCPDMGSWPKRSSKVLIPNIEETVFGLKCHSLPFLNITRLKRIDIYKKLSSAGAKWCDLYNEETKIITVYGLIYPYIKAAVNIKRNNKNVKICCIVADLPEYFDDKTSYLRRLLDETNKTYELCKEVDFFVLLTEQMKEPLSITKQPYLIMEGIYQQREIIKTEKEKKCILYTGKLDARFGLPSLMNAFVKIDDPECKLWICGDGADKETVLRIAEKDPRIIYWGMLKQDEVFKMQARATILINPRKPEGEYTKYSFPSKTMEYMASGTPTLMYKLPGMPEEYINYVGIIPNGTDEDLKSFIEEYLNKDEVTLHKFGLEARNFILEHKTSKQQIKRYVDFLSEHLT